MVGETSNPIENNVDPVNEIVNEEEEVVLGDDGRKLRSVVWKYFERNKVNGEWKAICKACSNQLTAKGRSGTSHLSAHLGRCLKIKNKVSVRQLLLQAGARKEGVSPLTMGKFKFNTQFSRNELFSMIVRHEYPLAMVDHTGFRRYSASLNPDFKVVTRNTVKSDILKAYTEERSYLMKLFAGNDSRVAITTDMWTSGPQKKGYMAVTAHFIDSDWILQNRLIRFMYVPCPHNARTISKALVSCLKSFDLDEKVSTITVDNCTTNNATMDILLEKLESSKLILRGSHLHMRCCAHILNLVVTDGLDVIRSAIEKVRDVVAYCVSTPKRYEKFEDACNYCKLIITRKLVLDCKTRWNSCYEMLQIALLYRDAFIRLKSKTGKDKFVLPSKDEWQMASDICDRLAIFKRATDAFSGRLYPTANLYFQKVCEIRLALRKWLTCGNKIVESMTVTMIDKFDKYWIDVNGFLAVASVLDPRRKLECVSFYFGHLYGDNCDNECGNIKRLLLDLVEEYEYRNNVSSNDDLSVSNLSVSLLFVNDHGKRPLVELDDVEGLWEKHVSKKPRNRVRKCEVEAYLAEDNIIVDPKHDNTFNLLGWWKAESSKYPILSKVARDILAVPISTVASESAFSTGGRVVGPHRSRLLPDTVEALMCLQSWRIFELKDEDVDEEEVDED